MPRRTSLARECSACQASTPPEAVATIHSVSPSWVQAVLERDLQKHERDRARRLSLHLQRHGITIKNPPVKPDNHALDATMQHALSRLALQHGHSLVKIVELVRGQTTEDPRPNKALCPDRLRRLLAGYQHCDLICQIAAVGVSPRWQVQRSQRQAVPDNHQSANRHLHAVLRSIRRGQDAGQYLVLDDTILRRWKNTHVSPLGTVAKKDIDPSIEVRLIHDLSFPRGRSTNEASAKSEFPPIDYRHVVAIVRRIEACAARFPGRTIWILKGDVKGAFRHLMLASRHVRWMGARIPQCRALIVDMSAPFGWTGSPAYYGVFGSAISWHVGRESPATILGDTTSTDREAFFPYEWVDDNIPVEPDTAGRLQAAEACLRLAMMAVLGPRAINEAKFSAWSTNIEVLGLEFNSDARTVAMPRDKLGKAAARVTNLQRASSASRHELNCLLGSLRHVMCILRSAKPFYQRVHTASKRAPSRGRVPIGDSIRLDLRWFQYILIHGLWSGLPSSMFGEDPPIDVHWYMDASDYGLAVADSAQQRSIQLTFDDQERSMIRGTKGDHLFNINVRELLCVALAAVLWTLNPARDRQQDSAQLIRFAVFCWRPAPPARGNSASTILSKIGHLSWIHRRFCGFPVGLHEGHQLAMRGMSRLSPPPQRKDPFTVDLLRCMRSQLKFDSTHDRVLRGAAVMGIFFMLRRSEYLPRRRWSRSIFAEEKLIGGESAQRAPSESRVSAGCAQFEPAGLSFASPRSDKLKMVNRCVRRASGRL
ncbi:hypothetical protein PHYSODRAFT_324285 [Phytophthora sojae]|uniref:Reverse transcriptase domain-containing protein n=1 Tax=Phytophthora sojae (strain P6497) TaxID=1094619 RepID=G4YT96_PHYSP|nr:hypothetical protein PHYSODRAFT_324285 [Phytophthora sojae]EGZ23018.1 hypothetical protein PHYSODRAFT_324285 [Phytophthora sojae]|eukprot:XP_009518306.1 hypothetical protein PHYSODRAFT_324285 [Phytophthora sojae]